METLLSTDFLIGVAIISPIGLLPVFAIIYDNIIKNKYQINK